MDQKNKRSKTQRRRRKRIIRFAATIIIIIAAVVILLYQDYFTADGLRSLFSRSSSTETTEALFTYETGTKQSFARAGNGLAVASATGMQLIDGEGNTILRQIFSMEVPAVSSTSDYSAFYDVGGTILKLATSDGDFIEMDTKQPIISVSVSTSGHMAVTTEEPGYKGKVTVYNSSQSPVYQWFSGSGYVLSAVVNPEGNTLAVLCAEGTGGVVRLFSLSSEKEQGNFVAENQLFVDLNYMDGGRLCAISESQMVFLNNKGQVENTYDFGDLYLIDYELSGSFAALLLGKYRSGIESTLITVNSSGHVLGQIDVQQEVLSLSAADKNLLVLSSDTVTLYSRDLSMEKSKSGILGIKKAILRERGDVLLLSSYSAELLSFN